MESGEIYKLIPKVSAAVGAIAKARYNEQQRFKYRGIDDVLNSFHKPLADFGVLMLPTYKIIDTSERQSKSGGALYVVRVLGEFRFAAGDGSSVTASTLGEAMDSADKAVGKAMSVAMKNVMFQVFCVPLEGGLDEPDADTPEDAGPPPLTPEEQAIADKLIRITNRDELVKAWKALPSDALRGRMHPTFKRAGELIAEAAKAEAGAA